MEEIDNMDVWKSTIETRVNNIQNQQVIDAAKISDALKDIADLKLSDKLQDNEISALKTTLSEIKDDTNWIRRKITGALITAVITAIVGGIVGIAIANIF
ncbi:hemolysin XhlA family protein [Psychrobacillus sp. FSL K6-1464]|uniref:hemolysin XhlA family protein n=1 Tax=Psychrobacillus sp. FSL K6-1464 TaxID=2921545 RepID=UPI0030F93C27